jgi:hypothetical protein
MECEKMSVIQYLQDLISDQRISQPGLNEMHKDRERIINAIKEIQDLIMPDPYYGGSYGKKTMIAEAYDLDLVFLYPSDIAYSIRDIYFKVLAQLQRKFTKDYHVYAKNVAIRIEKREDYHIDVVPGKRMTTDDDFAWLYKNKTGEKFQTNIKKHIETISECGRRDVLKLLKLWKIQNLIEIPSFLLELIGIRALDQAKSNLSIDEALCIVLKFISYEIQKIRINDPANSNNNLTSEDVISESQKGHLARVAKWSLQKGNQSSQKEWEQIFQKKSIGFSFESNSSNASVSSTNNDKNQGSSTPRLSIDSPPRRFA